MEGEWFQDDSSTLHVLCILFLLLLMVVSYTIRSQRLETPVLDDSWFRISASISPSDTSHWPFFLKHRAHNVTLMLASVMILHPLDSSNFQERQKGFPYSCSYLYLIYLARVSFIATPRTSFSIPVSLPWFFFLFLTLFPTISFVKSYSTTTLENSLSTGKVNHMHIPQPNNFILRYVLK